MNIEIRKIENKEFREVLFSQYFDLVRSRMLEFFPNNKHLPESVVMRWLEDDEEETVISFNAFYQGQLIGQMDVISESEVNPEYEINKGQGKVFGYVRKEFRRSGVGTQLLNECLHSAREVGIQTLSVSTFLESGDRFVENLGGIMTGKFSGMRLEMSKVDWDLIGDWLGIPLRNGLDLTFNLFTKINDDFIRDIVDLSFSVKNDLIRINQSEKKILWETEERKWRESGVFLDKYNKNYYCFLVKNSCGKAIGYTEAGISFEDQSKVSQYVTGVVFDQRGKGIGKYLKSLMLNLIRSKHPEITHITTGNNDLNASMLGINNKLGFKKTDTETSYKLIVEDAQERFEK